MSIDSAARGLAAKALPRSGGAMTGGITTPNLGNTPDQSVIAGVRLGTNGNGQMIDSTAAAFTLKRAGAVEHVYLYNAGGQSITQVLTPLGIQGTIQNPDVVLYRDAAGVLGLRNGASAQAFRAYNSFTDAANGEWAELAWSSNVAYLRAQKNGSGTQRLMAPVTGATTVAGLPGAATAGAGARLFVTDATATTFLSTVAGGGANKVPVVSDGTNWLIG